MFINKLQAKSDSSKMSSYINLFLKTEVTCIPRLLQNYLGNYYSNALCNAATWVFVIWCVLHLIFDKIIDVFLIKLRYREYVRLRLTCCLWYLGFYGTALVYCGATLSQNEVELFNFKKMQVPTSSSLPPQIMLGYTLISMFYLHSALWEVLTKESYIRMFSYLFLFAVLVSSYIHRIVETSFTLTALIAIAQVAIEFTRCCFMSSNQDTLISKLVVGMLCFLTLAIYVVLYIIIIPLTFVVPLGLKIMSDYPNILLVFLFTNMVLWLVTDIYQSILFKFVEHWFYHESFVSDELSQQCSGGLLECSLFTPRDDVSYNLQIEREEIKSRETKMMSMRKPKNKNMLIQTLKCMVAIKRKLSEKRLSDSSDSDDSEKSEDSDLRTSENTDDDTGEMHSDQDEESDDEESESQESVIENKKLKAAEHKSIEANENIGVNILKHTKSKDENVDFNKGDNPNDANKCDITKDKSDQVCPVVDVCVKKPNLVAPLPLKDFIVAKKDVAAGNRVNQVCQTDSSAKEYNILASLPHNDDLEIEKYIVNGNKLNLVGEKTDSSAKEYNIVAPPSLKNEVEIKEDSFEGNKLSQVGEEADSSAMGYKVGASLNLKDEIRKDVESNRLNQVGKTADSSANEDNVIAPLPFKDIIEIKNEDVLEDDKLNQVSEEGDTFPKEDNIIAPLPLKDDMKIKNEDVVEDDKLNQLSEEADSSEKEDDAVAQKVDTQTDGVEDDKLNQLSEEADTSAKEDDTVAQSVNTESDLNSGEVKESSATTERKSKEKFVHWND